MPLATSNTLLRDPNKQAASNVLQNNIASAQSLANTQPTGVMANAPAPTQTPVQKAVSTLGTLAPSTSSWLGGAGNAVSVAQKLLPNAGFGSVPGGGPTGQRLIPGAPGTPGGPEAPNTPADATPAGPDQAKKDILGAGYENKTDIDTTKSDAFTKDQIDIYKGTQDWTKNAALNAMSNSMRAAGAASQHGGLAPGSSSYLSNWRQATATGQRNLNDIMAGWQKGMSGILGDAATGARGIEVSQGTLDSGVEHSNASGVRDLQDKQMDAQTDKAAHENIGSIEQAHHDWDYLFNDNNFKEKRGTYESLFRAYENAMSTGTPEQQAAAYKTLMDFVQPYAAQYGEFDKAGKPGHFREWAALD